MYTYIYVCIHTYVCISAIALCAFGVTGLVNVAIRLLLSDCISGFLFDHAPPIIRTAEILGSRRPHGPPLKVMICTTSPCSYILFRSLDPSYNSCKSNRCSIPNVLVTFSLSSKSIIFRCSFRSRTKRESNTIQKRTGLPSKLIDLGLKFHLPISCTRRILFMHIQKCNTGCVRQQKLHYIFTSLFRKHVCFEQQQQILK